MAYTVEDLQHGFLDWLARWDLQCAQAGVGHERLAMVHVNDSWIYYHQLLRELQGCGDPMPPAALALVYTMLQDDETYAPMSYAEAAAALYALNPPRS